MKQVIVRTIALSGFLLVDSTYSAPTPVRISVTEFNQKVDHIAYNCRSWEFTQQGQLRTLLESELTGKGMTIVEREKIREIYDNEFEMKNLDPSTVQKRNQFKAAEYTITGGITELGVCEDTDKSGIKLGGIISLLGGPDTDLSVKKRKSVSTVTLTAKLVSTRTGEVVRSFTENGKIEDNSYGVDGEIAGVGGSHENKKLPPIERASKEAIQKLAVQIAQYIQSQ